MAVFTIELDSPTEERLQRLSRAEGRDAGEVAARLLARAIRAARPRRTFDAEAILAANSEFVQEDEALAESGSRDRADLLAGEDAA